MGTARSEGISIRELERMAERAGLSLSREEVEKLKPLYDLYTQYIRLVHEVDLKAEEMGVTFSPTWPVS